MNTWCYSKLQTFQVAFWTNGILFKVVPCTLLTVSIIALLKIIKDVSVRRKSLAQVCHWCQSLDFIPHTSEIPGFHRWWTRSGCLATIRHRCWWLYCRFFWSQNCLRECCMCATRFTPMKLFTRRLAQTAIFCAVFIILDFFGGKNGNVGNTQRTRRNPAFLSLLYFKLKL